MKVAGDAVLHAPVDEVWKALNDPAVLVRTIPGCERLEEIGPDAYRMTMTAGVASIKGTYDGEVRLTDQQQPTSFVLRASGSGAPGTVDAVATVTLTAEGERATRLRYDADATVGGMVSGVGQRVLVGVAKKTAAEFFRNVDDVLTGKAPAEVPVAAAAAGAPQAAVTTGVEGAPVTYTRPPAAPVAARGDELLRGALVGAAIALLGVLVGGLVARRRS